MSKVQIKFHDDAIGELLKHPKLVVYLTKQAKRIAGRANASMSDPGHYYTVSASAPRKRANVIVVASHPYAIRDNAEHNRLVRLLSSGWS